MATSGIQTSLLMGRSRLSASPYTDHYHNIKHPELLSYQHLHVALPTNKILNEFQHKNVNINDECLHLIIDKIFGNAIQFIRHLLKTRNEAEISDIYDILKKEKVKYDDDNKNDTIAEENNCFFNILSLPSISNICSFLTKLDITSFKCTSSIIAIECLKQMRKYKINTFNMNELYLFNEYQHLSSLIKLKTNKLIKQNRYSSSKTLNDILAIWSKKYNIDPKNMLLLTSEQPFYYNNALDSNSFVSQFSIIRSNILVIDDAVEYANTYNVSHNGKFQYLIFDKTKMSIIYDANKITEQPIASSWNCSLCTFQNMASEQLCLACGTRKMNSVYNFQKHYKDKSVVLLNYFDLQQQTIKFIRYLLVHTQYTKQEMTKYIENGIMSLLPHHFGDENEKNRFLTMYTKMKEYGASNTSLIKVYNLNDRTRNHFQVWIFSINDQHPIFKQYHLNALVWHYEMQLNERFSFEPHEFLNNIYRHLANSNKSKYLGNITKLSPVLIANLCSFLHKEDILSFKLVSASTAMACLSEMRKARINSFSMNCIESNDKYRDLLMFKNVSFAAINVVRVHKGMTFNNLLQIWSKQYSIPIDNMIFCISKPNYNDSSNSKILQIFTDEMEGLIAPININMANETPLFDIMHSMKKSMFLICDRAKLWRINHENKSARNEDDITKSMIILLNYYGVKTEQIRFCRSLLITEDDEITMKKLQKYIKDNAHQLIPNDNNLIEEMKQFDDEEDIFDIYSGQFANSKTMIYAQYNEDRLIFDATKPLKTFIFQFRNNNNRDLLILNDSKIWVMMNCETCGIDKVEVFCKDCYLYLCNTCGNNKYGCIALQHETIGNQ